MIPIRFPSDSIFNRQVSAVPLHAMSDTWREFFDASAGLTTWTSGTYGMGIQDVTGVPGRLMTFVWDSDLCPFPLQDNTVFDRPGADQVWRGVDTKNNVLYEIYSIMLGQSGHNDHAYCGARWYLDSNRLRPEGWPSASESGLPLSPLTLRYDEAHEGEIRHALAFSLSWPAVANSYVWPARHVATYKLGILPNAIPLGTRLRLRSDYQVPAGTSLEASRVLVALREYGAFLSDRNGSISTPSSGQFTLAAEIDPRWGSILDEITQRTTGISQYIEFVDESKFMADPNSGRWKNR